MGLADTAKLIAELSLDDKFSKGAKSALGTLGKLEKGTSRVGKGAGQLSAGLARSGAIIAAGVGTGLGFAAKSAIDFQDAFQGVVKTVDEADLKSAGLSFDQLSGSLRKMATEIPISAVELSNIAANAGALGVAGKDIESFTRTVALLGETTNVSSDDAATALGQLQNVIGLTGDDFDNFGASLVDLGNKGASTEADILEIARRSGAAAKLFGVAKKETLGWAAAVANLGVQPELAGTALQNLFLKSQRLVTDGGKGLRTFAKVAGQSVADFRKSFKKDAGGTLQDFVKGLSKLPKAARLETVTKLFGKGSGLTRVILGLADSYDKNLVPALDDAADAWDKNTALTDEASKRFATVKSSITLLRNNLTEAAITLGEGFAPALGRAAGRLSEFLKQDANKSALKKLGEDIGKAIDGIDWQAVLDGAREFVGILKIALDYGKRIFDVINSLPTEIKAAGLGFLALDKLSGGLVGAGVGNIVGGLGETLAKSLAARIPLFGSAFVQPVFVTNMGAGLGGGIPGAGGAAAGGAAGGGGLLAGATIGSLIAPAVAAALATGAVTSAAKGLAQQVGINPEDVHNPVEGILNPFANVGLIQDLINVIQHPPAPPPVPLAGAERKEAQQAIEDVRDSVESGKIAGVAGTAKVQKAADKIREHIETAKLATSTRLDKARAAVDAVKAANNQVRDRVESAKIAGVSATQQNASTVSAAMAAAASVIVAGYAANRPVIQATTINNVTQKSTNSGPRSGSRNTGPLGAGGKSYIGPT